MSASLPWFKFHVTLIRHPKSRRLARLLRRTEAWPRVAQLWAWSVEFAPTGDLSKFDDQDIADAAGWKGGPTAFVEALREAGFLDGSRRLHDWDEYQSAHVAHAERQAPIDPAWDKKALCAQHGWDDTEWDRRYRQAVRKDITPAEVGAKVVRDSSARMSVPDATDTEKPSADQELSAPVSVNVSLLEGDQDPDKDQEHSKPAAEPVRSNDGVGVAEPEATTAKPAALAVINGSGHGPRVQDFTQAKPRTAKLGERADVVSPFVMSGYRTYPCVVEVYATWAKQYAPKGKLSPTEETWIVKAFSFDYTTEDLCQSVLGWQFKSYYQGKDLGGKKVRTPEAPNLRVVLETPTKIAEGIALWASNQPARAADAAAAVASKLPPKRTGEDLEAGRRLFERRGTG